MEDGPVAAQIIVTMCALFGVAFLAGFFLQWNRVSIQIRCAEKLAAEWKSRGKSVALLRWWLVTPWIVVVEIWDETRGCRFLVPIGAALCATAYVTYALYLK